MGPANFPSVLFAVPRDADKERLVTFTKSGGGLFLTGEWGCCSVNEAVEYVMNRLVVTVGGIQALENGSDGGYVNEGVVGLLPSMPRLISTWQTASPGHLGNVTGDNVFFSTQPDGMGQVLAGAWSAEDLVGDGRAVVMMDINWIGNQYRGDNWTDVASNVAFFLSGRATPPVSVTASRVTDAAIPGRSPMQTPQPRHPCRRQRVDPPGAFLTQALFTAATTTSSNTLVP